MPSIATLKRWSAASGLGFGCFLFLHLLNHCACYLGWDTAHELMFQLRKIYQNPILEILLVACIAVHVYSNACVFLKRRKIMSFAKDGLKGKQRKNETTLELIAHRYTGYFLVVTIVGHVTATRIAPFFVLDHPSEYDYSFATAVNQILPSNMFAVYLFLFGSSGVWHLTYGTRSALATLSGSSVVGKPFPKVLSGIAMFALLGLLLGVLSVIGVFYDINLEAKSHLHDKINAVLGV